MKRNDASAVSPDRGLAASSYSQIRAATTKNTTGTKTFVPFVANNRSWLNYEDFKTLWGLPSGSGKGWMPGGSEDEDLHGRRCPATDMTDL